MFWFSIWTTSWGSHISQLHRSDAQSQPTTNYPWEWRVRAPRVQDVAGKMINWTSCYLLPASLFRQLHLYHVTIFIVHCRYCQYLSLAAVHFNYITFQTKTFVGWGEPRNPLFFLPWHSQIFSKRRIKTATTPHLTNNELVQPNNFSPFWFWLHFSTSPWDKLSETVEVGK